MKARAVRSLLAFFVSACTATLAFADEPPATTNSDIFSNNAWGDRGGYHTHSARPLSPGALVMTVSDTYASSSNMFAQGDSDVQSTLGIAVVWSPVEGLELGINEISVVNKYDDIISSSYQLQGNPTLLVKYSAPVVDALGLGALVYLMFPTSQGGDGLDPSALALRVEGLASYRVSEFLDLSANVGYVFDRSDQLFAGQTITPLERYVYGINGSESRLAYGLAAIGNFEPAGVVGISPFVEWWGEYSSSVSAGQNPSALTVGAKVYPARSRVVEGQVGVDVRLGGEPHAALATAGLPKWQLLLQLSLHLGESIDDEGLARRCEADAECGSGHVCDNKQCALVKEVVTEKVVEKEVVRAPLSVALNGGVFDADSGQPLAGAEITVSGQPDPITVNSASGRFSVCPLPADGGLLKITARALGYVDAEQTVSRSAASGQTPITFKLRSTGNPVTGTFKGSVRDGSTGRPIERVSVVVPAAALKVPVQSDGSFDVTLKVGRYQVLVSAPNYETQKKEVIIQSDQVVIIDVDLTPKKGGKGPKALRNRR